MSETEIAAQMDRLMADLDAINAKHEAALPADEVEQPEAPKLTAWDTFFARQATPREPTAIDKALAQALAKKAAE